MGAPVEAIKKNLAKPIGSHTQMGSIRLGKRTENRYPKIKDFVPLVELDNLVFGGWDIYNDNVYESAMKAKVLDPLLLNTVKYELEKIKPMPAVFDRNYVRNLDGTHVKKADNKYDLALEVMKDIDQFCEQHYCDRLVMIWCGSTEKYIQCEQVHANRFAFEAGLRNNAPSISPSMNESQR